MIDVIKLLDDAYCRLRYGAGVRLTWPVGGDYTGADVERLLRSYGVRVYARQYAKRPGDEYGLHVRTTQARWARYLCRRAGVPLSDECGRGRVSGVPRALPRPWGKGVGGVGLTGRLLDWLT